MSLAAAWALTFASCACAQGLQFDPAFGDEMVLQRSPAQAAVFGTFGNANTTNPSQDPIITVTVAGNGQSYSVAAAVIGRSWKALLRPAHSGGGSFTISATANTSSSATSPPAELITLSDVVFGDVWYCGGQSNMALSLAHTVSRNASIAAIAAGKYANIRLYGIQGNMNPNQPWATLKQAVAAGTTCVNLSKT